MPVRSRWLLVAAVAAAALLTSGCASTMPTAAVGPGATVATDNNSAAADLGAAGVTGDLATTSVADPTAAAAALCGGIPVSDVNPLLKKPTRAPVIGSDGETCDFLVTAADGSAGEPLRLVVNVSNDAGMANAVYLDTMIQGSDFGANHPLAGLGTGAMWGAPGTGGLPLEYIAPRVAAYQGQISCEVIPPSTIDTTVAYTVSGGNPQITPAAAAAYAQLEAVLCGDVFAGKTGALAPAPTTATTTQS